jgi:hypothetical protein
MILRAGRNAFAAILVLAPAIALAGDGTFGVPASGILSPPPPKQTAALMPAERNDLEKQRPVQRVQQTYSPAPAAGAGRSRVLPPSETPEHAPIVVPPKKKRFGPPVAMVDPTYIASADDVRRDTPQPGPASTPVPASAPVMAQGRAVEPKRGLFTSQSFRARSAASAAGAEHTSAIGSAPPQTAPVPLTASRQSPGSARIARDGTPCAQLRGVFTSPPECR